MSPRTQTFLSQKDSTVIKGISIVAVFLIHASVVPNTLLLTVYDQSLRFAVPLFVFLSGYGLAMSHQNQFEWRKYLTKRVGKLGIIYALWSLYLVILLKLVPSWEFNSPIGQNWWQILFLGQADYHLYFLPMLLQLYLLFPLINRYSIRTTAILSILAFMVQVIFYLMAGQQKWGDQWQYSTFLAWIGYFTLGIFLAKKPMVTPRPIWALGLVLASVLALSFSSRLTYHQTNDLVFAMRSTKIVTIPFALSCIFGFWVYKDLIGKVRLLEFLGRFSFLIYLFHTLIFRLVKQNPGWLVSIWIVLATIILTIASHQIMTVGKTRFKL